jgi:STE24 endopeptidase
LFFVSSIPSIPFSAYQTFVLEEKHGFNKMTSRLFVTDTIKGWLVGFALGGPLLAAFLKIFKWAGDSFIPFLMAFLSVFFCLNNS